MKIIDFRSDTVTKPTPEMRKAMYEAEVGDDVYQEDPTANKLQEYVADLFGKEAALFVTSGVMGNQICLNVLTNPGDEVICEKDSHIFWYESGTGAKLSGIQLHLIEGNNGIMPAEKVRKAIRPESAYYMPRSKVIEIENTHNVAGGTVIPIENIKELSKIAKEHSMYIHLDGARIWNASIASNISLKEYAKYFDTASCCLSKGLGAPIGSVIIGDKSFINEAFRVRKAIGGGMRQVGIIAAAGLYALQNNFQKLAEDHIKAKELAKHLRQFDNVDLNFDLVQTNILIFKLKNLDANNFINACKEKNILLGFGGNDTLRIVTHLDITFEDIEKAKNVFTQILEK